ncbi:hypothetical protein, partial [Pseudomonas sp. 2822-17]|uniref:hypothetical protein n=1 Tax=Pseudomonas sp. 2822-17 TaxID=1712678 RepID=UPI001C4815B2
MASNDKWSKSVVDWKSQLFYWLTEEKWESLRNFSIFFDSRVLVGEEGLLMDLKKESFRILQDKP